MSNAPNKPKSCTGRLFGSLVAFAFAAAVVYVGSYLILFQITGKPSRNEEGWLGAPLRYLNSAPFEESGETYFYKGDTAPYRLFQPLNDAWLKTKELPENPAPPASESTPDERSEGRGGRRQRDRGDTSGTQPTVDTASDDADTTGAGNAAGEDSPRRRGRRGEGPGSNPNGQELESTGGDRSAGETTGSRRGRRGSRQSTQSSEVTTESSQ